MKNVTLTGPHSAGVEPTRRTATDFESVPLTTRARVQHIKPPVISVHERSIQIFFFTKARPSFGPFALRLVPQSHQAMPCLPAFMPPPFTLLFSLLEYRYMHAAAAQQLLKILRALSRKQTGNKRQQAITDPLPCKLSQWEEEASRLQIPCLTCYYGRGSG